MRGLFTSGNKTRDRIIEEGAIRELLAQKEASYSKVLFAALALSLIINLVLVYAVVWRFPVKQFLWTKDAAYVCDATPLSDPIVSQARLKDLAQTAAVELNSYGYLNWQRSINNALDKFFTPRGADAARKAIAATGIINKVVDQYVEVGAVSLAPPRIIEEGRTSGRYYWLVEVPLVVTYATNAESKRESRLFTFRIVRVDPSPINTNGVAIDEYTSTQFVSSELNKLGAPR